MMYKTRLLVLAMFTAGFAWVQQGTREQVTMTPTTGVSGEWSTWTLQYTIGATPIQTGGSIRVQLPLVWHGFYRNSPHSMHTVDQFAPNYVSVRTSNPDVQISWEVEGDGWRQAQAGRYIKHRKLSLSGDNHRYAFVLRVTLESGPLVGGDVITVTYGDKSEGSPGFYGPITAPNTEPILMAVDYNGNGEHRPIRDTPSLTAVPGPAVELVPTMDSDGVAGQPSELHLSFLDLNYNGALGPDRRVRLSVVDGDADLPAVVIVSGARAWMDVTVVPRTTGILRIQAVTEDGAFAALSNPMKVHRTEPERRVYWGDLHNHGYLSWDGVGKDYFPYARDLADLDFYALTDHAGGNISRETMQDLAEDVIAWYEPRKFVTLLAYEVSYGRPYGHHNVFFRGTDVQFYATPQDMILPELLKRLKVGEAFAVPHGLNHEPRYERSPVVPIMEMYSLWGTSELNDQADDLSYWKSDWKTNRLLDDPVPSYPNPGYIRNIWKEDVRLGVIASSDDHRGRPGKRRGGIAAVYAPDLTREGIFDALLEKYTYGTTGDRILVDFAVNGARQGSTITTSGNPAITLEAHGTDVIAWVEIVKHQIGSDDYEVLRRVEPDAMDVSLTVEDPHYSGATLYYARLRQKTYVRNRPVQAWSSPVWVEP